MKYLFSIMACRVGLTLRDHSDEHQLCIGEIITICYQVQSMMAKVIEAYKKFDKQNSDKDLMELAHTQWHSRNNIIKTLKDCLVIEIILMGVAARLC